jgi:DHA2 family multidrug resistance protein
MVAYVDDFRLMLIITIACMPMLLLMRKPRPVGGEPLHAVID